MISIDFQIHNNTRKSNHFRIAITKMKDLILERKTSFSHERFHPEFGHVRIVPAVLFLNEKLNII